MEFVYFSNLFIQKRLHLILQQSICNNNLLSMKKYAFVILIIILLPIILIQVPVTIIQLKIWCIDNKTNNYNISQQNNQQHCQKKIEKWIFITHVHF